MPERARDRSTDVAQPAGRYIVNNCYEITESGESATAFAEEAAPAEGRQPQWQRVRAARADGRQYAEGPSRFRGWPVMEGRGRTTDSSATNNARRSSRLVTVPCRPWRGRP